MFKQFEYNPVLYWMKKQGEDLIVCFKKNKGVQERKYRNVPIEIIGKLFYTKSAKEALTYYSNNIKGKFEVIEVKNQ